MSRIHATARALWASATALRRDAEILGAGYRSSLLRCYAVECAMKERYLRLVLADPNGDTSLIPDEAFGRSGHDLDAGRKALRAPASVPVAPRLTVPARRQSVAIEGAHQVWRYGIHNEGSDAAVDWLEKVAAWMEESR